MPEISHQQAEALSALEWLLSDEPEDRRSGRSMAMAIAYLRLACTRSSQDWVLVFDHYAGSTRSARYPVMTLIEDIARDANLAILTNRTHFRVQGTPSMASVRYLFDQFIETDVQLGLSEEQVEQQRLRDTPPAEGPRPARGTMRGAILKYVHVHPGQSATQIANALGMNPATASSYLYRASRTGNLVRRQDGGPRGGATYYPLPTPEPPVVGMSVWERLRKPEVG